MPKFDSIKYLLKSLKHSSDPDGDFDSEQLRKGIKIEMEHTDSVKVAEAIAKAHLKEDAKYYDHLEDMENKFKK